MCSACGYRPALWDGFCAVCSVPRQNNPTRVEPLRGMKRRGKKAVRRQRPEPVTAPRLATWNRPSGSDSESEIEPALEALAVALADYLAARDPSCPRCGAPTHDLLPEPCPACQAELAVELDAVHEHEKARQRRWWAEHGQAWRSAREAAAKAAREG